MFYISKYSSSAFEAQKEGVSYSEGTVLFMSRVHMGMRLFTLYHYCLGSATSHIDNVGLGKIEGATVNCDLLRCILDRGRRTLAKVPTLFEEVEQ